MKNKLKHFVKNGTMNGTNNNGTMGPNPAYFTVTVVSDTDHLDKNKKQSPYKVAVDAKNGKKAVVYRKYQDFQNLYERLKKKFPATALKFPPKKLFSTYDNRKEGLAEFLQKILSDIDLSTHADVVEFLHINLLVNPTLHRTDSEFIFDLHHSENGFHENGDSNIMDLGPSEKYHARPGDFEFLKVIGKGSFGRVLLARHKEENTTYAVKVLNKAHIMRKNEAKHIMSERNVLVKNIKHPFLVGLHYSFQTSDKLYFVLDYVNGGELFYHLQKERCFSEARAKFYAAEIASALNYLHCIDIIYRDLKPENILFDSEGHVVLTDFGLCKEGMIGRQTTSTFCGTPEYLAPEVLRKQPYDKTVDWWCLGSVTYEMIYGLPPFYSRDTTEMYDNILHKPLKFRTSSGSLEARRILEELLQKEKDKRLGARRDFSEIRTHPFFSNINWNKLEARQIKPPYDPNVDGDLDLKHFDPEFVREPVPASVGRSTQDYNYSANNAFEGFSYVPSPVAGFYTGTP